MVRILCSAPSSPETRSFRRATVQRIRPLLLVLAAACAPSTPAPAPAPAPDSHGYEPPSASNAALRHREVHWFRTSAEYRALAEQVYQHASEELREMAENRAPGSWGVIMDADETILDNSEFQRRIAESGDEFEESLWAEWVREEAAGVIPAADRFVALVNELGGRVAIVTNRDEELCPATRRNLRALGIEAAAVLCRTDTSQKEPRFRRVLEGTTAEGLPPLEVVMWVGDNIGDFPDLEQNLRGAPDHAFAYFGQRFFVLPNPMYGSWMGNEWR